jgi:predicted alpha/beta hydrolase family esterase
MLPTIMQDNDATLRFIRYSHERIDAAINFYKAKGIDNIVLIAHGCGAHMSMSYLDKYGDSKIKGYINIEPLSTFDKLVKKHIGSKLRGPFNIEARKLANFSKQELEYLERI